MMMQDHMLPMWQQRQWLISGGSSYILADLTPCDYINRPVKKVLGGQSFQSDEEVHKAVHEWVWIHSKRFLLRSGG